MLTPLTQEFCGFERGRFEIDTWHDWIACPPHIALTNLNAPVVVAVTAAVAAPPPPLHPIMALARDIVQSLRVEWQHLVAAGIVAVAFLSHAANYDT